MFSMFVRSVRSLNLAASVLSVIRAPFYIVVFVVIVASYYAPLVAELLLNGYKKRVDLFGAAYDFRKAPSKFYPLE